MHIIHACIQVEAARAQARSEMHAACADSGHEVDVAANTRKRVAMVEVNASSQRQQAGRADLAGADALVSHELVDGQPRTVARL